MVGDYYLCQAMKSSVSIFTVLSIAAGLASCGGSGDTRKGKITLNQNILSECNTAIQNAVVVDHVPAPVGSRRYFYACAAAYESLVPFHAGYSSLAGQMHGLKPAPAADTSKDYCLDLVALAAHTTVSKKLVYKEDSITGFRERKLEWYKTQISKAMFENSVAYGDSIGWHIIRWAKKDSFDQYRGHDFYVVRKEEGKWQPTAPDYGDAVEPNWGHIRTSLVPAPDFTKIPNPEPYSKSKSSRFYKITKDVYDEVQKKDSANLLIAKYWDDNPNTVEHLGHVTISILKVSPAGHWLGMFSTVARQKKYTLMQSAEGFTRLSAAIFDAFICCWKEKYTSEYIRPETAVRKLIDSSWVPPIQTPAFPEYPSGHSVVSSAAATVLTHYFGDFEFTDSAEFEFGLGTRHFKGFRQAANEACISRFYGGIHFIDAIENGKMMGNAVGEYHLKNLKMRPTAK